MAFYTAGVRFQVVCPTCKLLDVRLFQPDKDANELIIECPRCQRAYRATVKLDVTIVGDRQVIPTIVVPHH